MLSTLLILSILSALAEASCLYGTSYLPRIPTSNGSIPISKFGYTALDGPILWHTLSPDNKFCNTGVYQSPINIDSTITSSPQRVNINLKNVATAEYENLGSTLAVILDSSGSDAEIGNTTFNLKQLHFHAPSEHRVNGEHFPLEMHMVHESPDKQLMVLAILFDLSENTTTRMVRDVALKAHTIARPGTTMPSGPLDFSPISQHIRTVGLVQYGGSLTTPPCLEGVSFVIAPTRLPLDVQSYNAIKRVLKYNSRLIQRRPGTGNALGVACHSQ